MVMVGLIAAALGYSIRMQQDDMRSFHKHLAEVSIQINLMEASILALNMKRSVFDQTMHSKMDDVKDLVEMGYAKHLDSDERFLKIRERLSNLHRTLQYLKKDIEEER